MNMDTEKSRWLDARRKAITDNFTLPADEQMRIDDLFSRMEQLAADCADQGEFEKRLGQSPLAVEYNETFTRIAKYNTMANEITQTARQQQVRSAVVGTIASTAKVQARGWFMQQLWSILPKWCHDLFVYRWYNIPVIGDILTWRNRKGFLDSAMRGAKERKELEKRLAENQAEQELAKKKAGQELAEAQRRAEEANRPYL